MSAAPQQEPSVYMSGSDLATRFHRCRRTIDRWVKDKEFKFPAPVMSGRGRPALWRRTDVEQWEAEVLPTIAQGE